MDFTCTLYNVQFLILHMLLPTNQPASEALSHGWRPCLVPPGPWSTSQPAPGACPSACPALDWPTPSHDAALRSQIIQCTRSLTISLIHFFEKQGKQCAFCDTTVIQPWIHAVLIHSLKLHEEIFLL